MSDLATIKKAVAGVSTENAAVAKVATALAANGFTKTPKVESTYEGRSTVRIYLWRGTPFGDLVLVAGPAIQPELKEASEIARVPKHGGAYAVTAAEADLTPAAKKALASGQARGAAFAATHGEPVKPTPAPRAERAPRAPAAPRARSVPTMAVPAAMVMEETFTPAPVAGPSNAEILAMIQQAMANA